MNILKRTLVNGKYRCDDIDVTVEEWKDILNRITDNAFTVLVQFCRMPQHKGSCKAVAKAYCTSYSKLISPVKHVGEVAIKTLNRFVIENDKGDNPVWVVPMQEGYNDSNGLFVWHLRDELVEAIQDRLLDRLIAFYKDLHKKNPFGGYTELYKWKLCSDCKNMEVADYLDIISKTDNSNLMFYMSLSSLKHMMTNNATALKETLVKLVDDSKDLKERLDTFRKEADQQKVGNDSSPGDERTAAVFLTCHDMNRYAFYMHDTTYSPFLKYLGIAKSKGTNSNYPQFLEVLDLLVKKVAQDEELKQIIKDSTGDYEQSDLMTAQTILWCMQEHWDEVVPIESLKDIQKFKHLVEYFVAHLSYVSTNSDQCLGYDQYIRKFVEDGTFKYSGQGWNGNNIQLQIAPWEDLKHGKVCVNIYGADYTNRGNYLHWKGTGINIMAEWNDGKVIGVKTVDYSEEDGSSWENTGLNFTIQQLGLFEKNKIANELIELYNYFCTKKEKIDEAMSKIGQVSALSKEAKRLLDNSGQIILQGAPGCGKTFVTTELAVYLCDGQIPAGQQDLKARYKELQKEGRIAFTTFHQSLDYEEFVEGLKPQTEGTSDEMKFIVKPGIFKRICDRASIRETTNFDECFEKFIEDIQEEEYFHLKTPKGVSFHVSVNNNQNLSLYTSAEKNKNGALTKERLYRFYTGTNVDNYWSGYYIGVINHLKKKYGLVEPVVNTDGPKPHVLIIDEINRANISKVLGELITLLEKSKRLGNDDEFTVTLPYSGETFGVPDNLYIIGTMNTADRSVGYIDYAIRRRFAFMTLKAEPYVIRTFYGDKGDLMEKELALFKDVRVLIEENISEDFESTDVMIGHSYFLAPTEEDFKLNLKYKIRPLLEEYRRDGILVDKEGLKDKISKIGE